MNGASSWPTPKHCRPKIPITFKCSISDTTTLDVPSHFLKLGGARAKPSRQTPRIGKAQSMGEVIPGVGGPACEQPCPTTAPGSIKMAYEPFILSTALGVAKCSTVRLLWMIT